MAEFCTCGSIMIAGSCSNKNCSVKGVKKASSAGAGTQKKERKTTKTRRASKCVTYNLYEPSEVEEAE